MYRKSSPGVPSLYTAGFTLVEIIVGIVVTGISLALVTALIYPLFIRSVDPMLQVRAAEYAQGIMQDILSRRYDHNTPVGGQDPCSVGTSPPCTAAGALGVDGGESSRGNFNDVDDYNAFCNGGVPNTAIQDVGGLPPGADYSGYLFSSCVDYAGTDFGGIATLQSAKRITVTVRPPRPALPVTISAYRGNY